MTEDHDTERETGSGDSPHSSGDEGVRPSDRTSTPEPSEGATRDDAPASGANDGPAPPNDEPETPPGAVSAGPKEQQLHPASVPYRSLSRSVSTGSLFFFIGIVASPGGAGANLVLIGAMVVVGILVGIAYEFAYYQRFRYRLTNDTFDVASGVVSRRDREVPLRRIQNVDVRQNVLQRALGIAAVHVETAGGGATEVTLQYVDETEARRLQRRLRDGPRERTENGEFPEDEADEEDEELLFEIQPNELAILSAFTIDPGASVLATIALSFASGFDPATLIPLDFIETDLPGTGLVAIAWAVLIFAVAAWVLSAALTFTRYYGFRLTRTNGELRYERGLLQRYSGTIPLEKVQTLTIKESVPFRWFGYGSLAVETAGYAPGQSGSRGAESAVPLAEAGRVRELARSVEPVEVPDLERSPRRARERYGVRYFLVVAALVAGSYALATTTDVVVDWYVTLVLLVLVPVAAHLKWTNRGFHLGDTYFFARTGFWRRTTKIVPHYRVQSVVYNQTIFQRRRRLASVTADTASSAAFFGRAGTAYDIDHGRALEVQRTLNERLQEQLRQRKHQRVLDRLATRDWSDEPMRDEATQDERDDERSSDTEDRGSLE
ncbi:PH domain-containing protein [Natronobiforma cellulositropha]|uniref:PH domain-containing protein n=1 Tax=Natronobiforma cellulositropha TaxID=1679076 RepID=UPI0021D58C07|nr:PH domain-containing protein [Natronobiforma cellulositropha]